MKLSHWNSVLDPACEFFFFKKEEFHADACSLTRMEASEVDRLNLSLLITELDRRLPSGLHPEGEESGIWLLNLAGPEVDTSVNRYLRGKRSLLKGLERKAVFQGSHQEDGALWWITLASLEKRELGDCLEILLGLSTSFVLIGDRVGEEPEKLARTLFETVRSKRADLQTRFTVPAVMNQMVDMPSLYLLSGYGSDDFGGYFLDVFSRRLPNVLRPQAM